MFVQLRNRHGKYLTVHEDKARGHHDPNHYSSQSSHFRIEAHPLLANHVVIRSHSGKFLTHDRAMFGETAHFHHDANANNAAWKIENHGSYIAIKSYHHHYLGLNQLGDHSALEHHSHPHDNHKFEQIPVGGFVQQYPPQGYAPQPAYGAPPPGYPPQGGPPPGYPPQGGPPPGYPPQGGAPPPGYGAPPPGYGAPPPGYAAPMPNAYPPAAMAPPSFPPQPRAVMLRNLHGKYVTVHDEHVRGHHNPNHYGPTHAHFIISPHPTLPGCVTVRTYHGKFLTHDHSAFGQKAHFYHDANSYNAAWKVEQHSHTIALKSHHHHYLGLNQLGDGSSLDKHNHPHDSHKFEQIPV